MNTASSATTTLLPALPLTAYWLRFTVRAETDICFHTFKGSALRGALAGTLARQYCPEWRSGSPEPLHRQLCPICQLLSWEHRDIEGGDIRRPYALIPPLDTTTHYGAGERLTFTLSLLGDRLHLLPYLILGVSAMGDVGVGRPDHHGQRGRFRVVAVDAVHPLTQEERPLVTEDGAAVQMTLLPVTHDHVLATSQRLAAALGPAQGLRLHFHTPLRLNQEQRLVKAPAFFPLVKQIALRLLDLAGQHGAGRPEIRLKEDLYPYVDSVTCAADRTRWQELTGFSQRIGRAQQLGGLVGEVVYTTPDWRPLLPWLVWGQIVQVGKNTVKGCGVYTLDVVEL